MAGNAPDPQRLGGLARARRTGGQLSPAEVLRRHPRGDFQRELVGMMRAEAAAVPAGRFGLLVRCGLPLAVRLAPFPS